MPNVAVLGSTSSHGGHIITASTDVVAHGIGVAREGDLHACPIHGHGITPMTSTSTVKVDGRSVVRVGDVAGCGAVIIQGVPDVNAA